jgi:signal transduction histidine kinase/CheY-like chemotaxis protein/HPt (histidine-containing phosphotransfer) domain-containing protein
VAYPPGFWGGNHDARGLGRPSPSLRTSSEPTWDNMGERGGATEDGENRPEAAPARDLPSGLFDSASISRFVVGAPSARERLNIVVEASTAQDLKAARERRLEVVQVPALRALGLNLVLLLFIAHEVWIRHAFDAAVTMTLAAVYTVYVGTSWLLLSQLFGRFPRLPLVVLSTDVFVWTLAVYLSGGNESWLFFLFMVRSIDQANTTVRRVLWFSHLSTLAYIGLVAWLHWVDGKRIDVGAEFGKVLILYVPNLYFLFTVRTAQRLRDRLTNTVRFAREEIGLRRTTEQALAMSKRDLEHVLREATQMAEVATRASKAKTDFLANVSHEIRTPMNAVIGMTTLLLESPLSQTQRDYAITLQQSARALLAIINDILDLSKIEAGKIELLQGNFALRDVVSEVVASVEYEVRKKGLALVAWVAPELPKVVRGDASRLRQVLLNLVANAVKFTDSGGVSIRVSPVDVEALQGSARAILMVRFEVLDTGVGIEKDFLPRLFEPFTQAASHASRRREGTGLGLSISKELVELFGGRIGVRSELGRGSAFRFTARFGRPLTMDAGELHPPPSAASEGEGIVLCVSDDPALGACVLEAAGPDASVERVSFEAAPKRAEVALASGKTVVVVVDGKEIEPALAFATALKRDRTTSAAVLVLAADLEGPELRRAWCHGFTGRCRREACTPKTVAGELRDARLGTVARTPAITAAAAGGLAAAGGSAEEAEANLAGASGARSIVPPGRARILLAEDNSVNQRVALAMLARFAQSADVVENGKDAIEAALARSYDLVLMDCQMPGMDGYEAARRIREQRPDLSIVAFTAHGVEGHRERSLAAGMNDHLTKPFAPEDLERVLQRWLRGGAKPPPPASEPRTLDREALVARLDGNRTLADELVTLFFEDVTGRLRDLDRVLAAGDTKAAREIAHAVKGGAASVHATLVSEVAAALEKAAAGGDLAESRRLAAELSSELARCRAEATSAAASD